VKSSKERKSITRAKNIKHLSQWYTSFSVDAMYFHMALENVEQAKRAKVRVDSMNKQISKLEKKEEEIIKRYNGDVFTAYSELEPIAIAIVDNLHLRLEEAYKPYLEALSLIYLLGVASLEAHINIRAENTLTGTHLEHFDKLSLEGKWLFYPKITGKSGFDPGREPFQSFSKIVKNRNKLVHYKNRQELWQSGKVPQFVDALGLNLKAVQHAVAVVKQMMLAIAKQFKENAPDWLKNKPISYFTFFTKE